MLTKPYAWSSSTQITEAIEFNQLVDHTGYRSLLSPAGERQVETARIVNIFYDRSLDVANITSAADLEPLVDAQQTLSDWSSRYPFAKPILARRIALASEEIARYRQANVKIDGQWHSAAEIKKSDEDAAAAQLRVRHQEDCDALLADYARPDISLEACAQIIARLAAVHCDTAEAQRITAQWQADRNAVNNLHQEIQAFLRKVDGDPALLKLAAAKDLAAIRAAAPLPADKGNDLIAKLQSLTGQIKPCWKEKLLPDACALASLVQLEALASDAKSKKPLADLGNAALLPNKNVMARSNEADAPVTAALDHCGHVVTDALSVFVEHCKQAQALEKQGKRTEAINEYNQAAEISREPEVINAIQDLRNQSLGL